jgi:hypothetical protein
MDRARVRRQLAVYHLFAHSTVVVMDLVYNALVPPLFALIVVLHQSLALLINLSYVWMDPVYPVLLIAHLLLNAQLKLQFVALMEVAAQDWWIVHLVLFAHLPPLFYVLIVNAVLHWTLALLQNFAQHLKSNVLVASVRLHSIFAQL